MGRAGEREKKEIDHWVGGNVSELQAMHFPHVEAAICALFLHLCLMLSLRPHKQPRRLFPSPDLCFAPSYLYILTVSTHFCLVSVTHVEQMIFPGELILPLLHSFFNRCLYDLVESRTHISPQLFTCTSPVPSFHSYHHPPYITFCYLSSCLSAPLQFSPICFLQRKPVLLLN